MAQAADLVVTVTDVERAQLGELGVDNVTVIPTIHDVEAHEHFGYAVRSGIIFIGGYGHTPNVDAARWLCTEIMPLVWRTNPDIRVTLLGNNPSPAVLNLRSARVTVTGFIADVGPFFEEARLFVAPLRYGAGMKGKVGHALSYGLPVVTTHVGADGYDLTDRVNCAIADEKADFARAIVDVYANEEVWNRYSAAGNDVIRSLGREAVSERLAAMFAALGVTA
jgi:glycosyltransferase involved in cell wall biosynthesis